MYFKFFIYAVILFLPLGLYADNGNSGNSKKGFRELIYSSNPQDSIKKRTSSPPKQDPRKPDTRTIQEKIQDARSAIKQVPRSAPKLKPQPVKEKVNIRTGSSSPAKKGSKRVPF